MNGYTLGVGEVTLPFPFWLPLSFRVNLKEQDVSTRSKCFRN